MTSTVDFLKLIGAPWDAFHDHPEPETARDYAQIRPVKYQAYGGYETVAGVYGCNYPGKTGEVQRARRDLIAQAPALYAYVAMRAEMGDTEAKLLLKQIHKEEA